MMIKKRLVKVILGCLACFQVSLICCSNNSGAGDAYSGKKLSISGGPIREKQVSFTTSGIKNDNLSKTRNPSEKTTVSRASLTRKHTIVNNVNEEQSGAHNITKDLPFGFVKDGSVDYTQYIQPALIKYTNIVFPGFPILINDKGLTVPSDRRLTFLPGSVLILKPSVKKTYNIINLRGASDVVIRDPVIKGDRNTHLGTEGEYGMGIAIRGGKNITIDNAKISECWGDGIYIGQDGNTVPKNISIKNAVLTKNRRDGISIISVDGLLLENIYAAYTNGTKPMCGINFETNNPKCEIKDVKVINPKTEYNGGSGIQVGIRTLLGGQAKKVNIVIINHEDTGSQSSAVKVACNRKSGTYGGSVDGMVSIINPFWTATGSGKPLVFSTDQDALKVHVFKARVKDRKGIMLGSSETKALLNKHANGKFEYSPN
jgi:hypothetical protein